MLAQFGFTGDVKLYFFYLIYSLLGLPMAMFTKKIKIRHKYLHFPIRNGNPQVTLQIAVVGQFNQKINVELADVNGVDWWAFLDVSSFKGETLLLTVLGEVPESQAEWLDRSFHQSDNLVGNENLYHEKLRPQFHFSARQGWIQDPVGLVFLDGEYHMFPLHCPYSWSEKKHHWGHAVSTDMIYWKELPTAMFPDGLGDMSSGSVVIDEHNSSGFQTGARKVMVAVYSTSTQVQCLAYSNDRGRTWTKYARNPIIGDRRAIVGNGNVRDPRVFWHKKSEKWIMVLFEGMGNSIFISDNLKDWIYKSHINNSWECPELFDLPVDGDPGKMKWVMYGAAGVYMIGDFDGKMFTMESGKHYYSTGKLNSAFKHKGIFYASQTFNSEPKNRRIQLGWGIIPAPGMPFNQMVTFPAELSLRTTTEGIRLCANPIKEIEHLHKAKITFADIRNPKNLLEDLDGISGELLHIKAEFELGSRHSYGVFGLRINGFEIEYDARHNRLNDAFLDIENGKIILEILMDRTSVEIYANHGRLYLADSHNSVDYSRQLELYSLWGKVHLLNLVIYELNSIWK